jgi:hypothetical protein
MQCSKHLRRRKVHDGKPATCSTRFWRQRDAQLAQPQPLNANHRFGGRMPPLLVKCATLDDATIDIQNRRNDHERSRIATAHDALQLGQL